MKKNGNLEDHDHDLVTRIQILIRCITSILDKIHRKKIDISDAIYVVNINGYIGESTRKEIEYANNNGKEVIYHEKVVL